MEESLKLDNEALLKISAKMNNTFNNPYDDVPVIGILTKSVSEENSPGLSFREIIEPKYLFLLQDAIVIPISLYLPPEKMKEALLQVNGLCLPGGSSNIWTLNGDTKQESDYTKAGRQLLKLAAEINNENINFPVLGICLGFQLMTSCIGSSLDIIEPCDNCNDYSTTLEWTSEAKDSKIYNCFLEEQRTRLSSAPLSFNFHSYMVDLNKFKENKDLNNFFKVVATSNSMTKDFSFITAIEGKNYPFFAFQHHPEWCYHDFYYPKGNIVNSIETIEIGNSIAKLFLSEAKKNKNSYPKPEELKAKSVVNATKYLHKSKGYVYLLNPID